MHLRTVVVRTTTLYSRLCFRVKSNAGISHYLERGRKHENHRYDKRISIKTYNGMDACPTITATCNCFTCSKGCNIGTRLTWTIKRMVSRNSGKQYIPTCYWRRHIVCITVRCSENVALLELGKLAHAYGALSSKDLTTHCPACRVPPGGYGTDRGDVRAVNALGA